MLREGGKKQPSPKKHRARERETEGKTGKKSMLWQSEEEKKNRESLRLRHPPCLPPPSWKHRVRALSLHILIMINAGSTTHTLKPRFWQGSAVVLCSGLWFCTEQLTLPSRLVKVKNHKLVKSQRGGRCGRRRLALCSAATGSAPSGTLRRGEVLAQNRCEPCVYRTKRESGKNTVRANA